MPRHRSLSSFDSTYTSRTMFSMKAGIAEINQLPDRQIEVKCLPTKGLLTLRSHSNQNGNTRMLSSNSTMELTWGPVGSKEPELVIPLQYGQDIQIYDKEYGILVLRTKPFSSDNHPYFFWSQESNKDIINTCLSYIQGELTRIQPSILEEMSGCSTLHLSDYIKRNNILNYAESNEFIMIKLMQFVPPSYRTKEKFIGLLHNKQFLTIFEHQLNTISDAMNEEGCEDFNKNYKLDMKDQQYGTVRSYLNTIYNSVKAEEQTTPNSSTPKPEKDESTK